MCFSNLTSWYFVLQIEREKLESDEINSRLRDDRERLDRSAASFEQESNDLQRQLQSTNQQLGEAEQGHARKLVELTSRHRQEIEMESERSRLSQGQLEKTQIARERAHKQRIKGLEEQVRWLAIRKYI
jgi:rootletin